MTANMPTLIPEVAFATAPADPAPTWVNVVADFRKGSTNRGRQRELDRYQAGTMDIVLNNRGRTYDPEYAAGTYAPNVKPMRRVRLRATWNSITYAIYDGYTDKWDQHYDPPREATATLRATDGFKVLAKAGLPTSVWAAEVAADNPSHWWRLDEPAGSTVAFDIGTDRSVDPVIGPGTYNGGVTLGTAGAPTYEADTAATFDAVDDYVSWAGAQHAVLFLPYTIEIWLKTTTRTTALDNYFHTQNRNVGGGNVLSGWVSGTSSADPGKVHWDSLVSTGRVDDNAWHHVVLTATSGAAQTLYIDGVAQATGTAMAPSTNANELLLGYPPLLSGAAPNPTLWQGDLDEFVIYATALSAARVQLHNTAGRTPWNGDTPGQRIGRILDLARWPAALRNLDTGSSTLQSATLAMTALDHDQKVADSEFGELFITRDGKVRLVGRTGLLNRAISATFGDGGGSELAYSAIGFDNGDLLIRNPVTVSRTGGVAQTSSDATGITNYLNHQFTLDGLYHNSDALSKDAADFLVSEYKDPKSRVTTLVVKPQRDPTNLWPIVLGAELGDVFTVIRRPQGIGSAISQNCEIQGIKHDIQPDNWTVTFTLSPAYTGAFLQLDLVSGPGLDSLRLYF